MTDQMQHSHDGGSEDELPPLEPWMTALARDVLASDAVRNGSEAVIEVPREMMWKRIEQRRFGSEMERQPVVASRTSATALGARGAGVSRWRGIAAIAAVLVGGVAIGRYAMPRPADTPKVAVAQIADSMAAPARIAMEEHLVRTVALLTAVRDRDPKLAPQPDVSSWARELLGTTRLLLDEPSLRDDRTRALLQDLELVLMQIIDARGTSAPEVRSAPTETMRETNLLPRVRAVMTAATRREELTVHGDDE